MRGLFVHRRIGFALLVAVWLPGILWRARLEASFWIDEIHSVLIAHQDVGHLLQLCVRDGHPPGYFLALKAWLGIGHRASEVLGWAEPGVLWARLLGVAAWLGLAAIAWYGGRRLLGAEGGTWLAWSVAGSAYAALWAREIRGYGIATVAIFAVFLLLLCLARAADGSRRRRAPLWALYVVAAGLALWTHLLSAIVLAVLGFLWAALFLRRRALLVEAVVANLVVAAIFAPWMVRVNEQVAALEKAAPEWMTPASWANLAHVFVFWYPFSRIGDPGAAQNAGLAPLGLVAVLLPLGVLILGAFQRTATGTDPDPAKVFVGRMAVLGLGAAAISTTVLWLLARAGLASVFHGPRYPSLAIHLWSAGLVAGVLWATARRGWRPVAAAVFLVPWLACAAMAQGVLAQREARAGLVRWLDGPLFAPDALGETIYLMPSSLLPFYRETLAALAPRAVAAMPCEARRGPITVLDVGFWRHLSGREDRTLRRLLESSRLAHRTRLERFPKPQKTYALFTLRGLDRERLHELCNGREVRRTPRSGAGGSGR